MVEFLINDRRGLDRCTCISLKIFSQATNNLAVALLCTTEKATKYLSKINARGLLKLTVIATIISSAICSFDVHFRNFLQRNIWKNRTVPVFVSRLVTQNFLRAFLKLPFPLRHRIVFSFSVSRNLPFRCVSFPRSKLATILDSRRKVVALCAFLCTEMTGRVINMQRRSWILRELPAAAVFVPIFEIDSKQFLRRVALSGTLEATRFSTSDLRKARINRELPLMEVANVAICFVQLSFPRYR